MTRTFLFLQGVCSPFFARLADALAQHGHDVVRMNFNAGDAWAWRGRAGWTYDGPLLGLKRHAREKLAEYGVSDVVLFGDQRPVHMPVVRAAREAGLRIHVFEEGYFRPSWITLERGGVNGNSLLPRSPDWYREVGASLPDYGNGTPFAAPMWRRAWYDVCYHLAGAANPLLVPCYRGHALHSAPREYAGYLWRMQRVWRRQARDAETAHALVTRRIPFFLLPLQLDTDAQIRFHSRYADMGEVLREVLDSFARHAPPAAHLLVKNHPLDYGVHDREALLRQAGEALGVGHRLHFIESGHLPTLLSHARGVVTVNSTVGGSALVHRCPLAVLGRAIYDMPGLSHQGGLDTFWARPARPDAELFRLFRNTVIHTTQVNGGFYSREGIGLALAGTVSRLEARVSELERLLDACPPKETP